MKVYKVEFKEHDKIKNRFFGSLLFAECFNEVVKGKIFLTVKN